MVVSGGEATGSAGVVGTDGVVLTCSTGLALVAFLAVVSVNTFRGPAIDDSARFMVEVENLSDDVGSISYRSQSENMFVVYLYKKDQDADGDSQTEPVDDSFFQ